MKGMPNGLVVFLLNVLFITLGAMSVLYGINHYADGGCENGLCGLAIFDHGIPMFFNWLILICALNACLLGEGIIFLILLAVSVIVNVRIIRKGYAPELSELVEPCYLVIVLQVLLVFYMYYIETKMKKNKKR